jgi:hypothetical protein
MSMGKDRRRAVKAYHARSSHTRPVLTTARVGPYGYIRAIYIRRYGTRDTTLAPWISKSHLFTGSQAHRLTRPQAHQSHQPPGSQSHQSPEPQVPDPLGHRITGLPISPATISTMVLGSPEPPHQ